MVFSAPPTHFVSFDSQLLLFYPMFAQPRDCDEEQFAQGHQPREVRRFLLTAAVSTPRIRQDFGGQFSE